MSQKGRLDPGVRRASPRASIAGVVAALVLTALVFVGSNGLRNLDAALIGYATVTIVLTFGVVYRYAMWVQMPPTRRYLVKGWRGSSRSPTFRRFPAMVPAGIVGYLGLQTFHKSSSPWACTRSRPRR